MEWTDDAVVLSIRPHGETSVLAKLLTWDRGRHAGLVRGGRGSRQRGGLEPGTLVSARWRGRLSEELGTLTLEPVRSYGAALFDRQDRLAALLSACSLLDAGLPEREPHPGLYQAVLALFSALEEPVWAEAYVRWEVGLLAELGFGLDLTVCAVSGDTGDLSHVSPRTGRAVSRTVAAPWGNRLLALPGFLLGQGGGPTEVVKGLALTGHFLNRYLPDGLPAARRRLAERYGRSAGQSGREGPQQS
jgi:DNA repair protein RecO (recombination protein O)